MINKEGKALVITIADIMTRDVVSILPETPIGKVISIFAEKNFAGLPVVDKNGILAGIITQYDLVIKGSGIHIPTLVKTLEGVNMIQPEKMILEETLAPIKNLSAKDMMNNDPLSVNGNDPIEKAVLQFAEHHKVNPIIVLDDSKKVIGVLSRHDLIKILAMKELGRVVETAIERGNTAQGAEAAVAGAMMGMRKEFLFMPKYGAKKWIFLGVAVFIIGLMASFLFIVKLPSGNNKAENISIVTVPIGEGATLSLKASKIVYGVGEEIPLDMYLSVKSGNVGVSRVGVDFPLPSGLLFTKFSSMAEASNFLPELEILNIKNSSLLFIFTASSSGYKTSPGETFYLGTAVFRATRQVQADINFSFSGPRTAEGSFVEEEGGTEILDVVSGASFVIR